MIEKKINRTAHNYITAFHIDFVRRECRLRRAYGENLIGPK